MGEGRVLRSYGGRTVAPGARSVYVYVSSDPLLLERQGVLQIFLNPVPQQPAEWGNLIFFLTGRRARREKEKSKQQKKAEQYSLPQPQPIILRHFR